MSTNEYPQILEGLESRLLDDCLVVLNRNRQQVHVLNETATVVSRHLDGKHSLEDIATIIVEQFDIDYESAMRDVEHIIQRFLSLGLLQTDGLE